MLYRHRRWFSLHRHFRVLVVFECGMFGYCCVSLLNACLTTRQTGSSRMPHYHSSQHPLSLGMTHCVHCAQIGARPLRICCCFGRLFFLSFLSIFRRYFLCAHFGFAHFHLCSLGARPVLDSPTCNVYWETNTHYYSAGRFVWAMCKATQWLVQISSYDDTTRTVLVKFDRKSSTNIWTSLLSPKIHKIVCRVFWG